jgi:hypothetical protein
MGQAGGATGFTPLREVTGAGPLGLGDREGEFLKMVADTEIAVSMRRSSGGTGR